MELRPEIRRVSRRIGTGIIASITTLGLMSIAESPRLQRSDESLAAFSAPIGSIATSQVASIAISHNLVEIHIVPTPATTTTQPQTPAEYAASKVTPLEFSQWSMVNNCEEHGNWHVTGPTPGGLGIKPPNWIHYGGQLFFGNEATATPDEQILVAAAIQPNPPDQNGVCVSW